MGNRIEGTLAALLLGLLALFSVLKIAVRNLGGGGLGWVDPVGQLAVLWLAMIGAVAAARAGKHITVELLPHALPARWLRRLGILTDGVAAVLCAMCAWLGGRFVESESLGGASLLPWLPAWAATLVLPVGFGLMAIAFVGHALRGFLSLREESRRATPSPGSR